MKKTIYYATGNHGKFEQVKNYLEAHNPNILLKQFKAEIQEIQTLDQKEIALDKAQKAWSLLKKPLIIDDSAIYFDKYNKFPGTLTRYVFDGLGFDGILKLINQGDRATFLLYLVYIDGPKSFKIFEGKCEGKLIKPKKFSGHEKLPYSCLFVPTGSTKTYAQLFGTKEGNKYLYRIKALKKFVAWLEKNKYMDALSHRSNETLKSLWR
jgi:XTP/dITP diphosphohydrolase